MSDVGKNGVDVGIIEVDVGKIKVHVGISNNLPRI
jgi:hypothetical protein